MFESSNELCTQTFDGDIDNMACLHQLYLRHMHCDLLTVTRMSTNQTLISNIFQESAIKLKRSAFIENSRESTLPWHTISIAECRPKAESMKNNKRITKAMNSRTTEMQHKNRLMLNTSVSCIVC